MNTADKTYDIIIIGAGPAGLSAALYARRANKKVLVLEANTYGGQIIQAAKLDNYPGTPNLSGLDFATTLYQQALNHGAEIIFEAATKISGDRVDTTEGSYRAKAIIIATGAGYRKLGLDDEQRLTGCGVSYCATCDGHFYKNKTVAVCGGGNTALTDALYLADLAQNVYLIHRRAEFRGEEQHIKKLKQLKNVHFILNATITALSGSEKLESITLDHAGKKEILKVDGLFVAIGQQPFTELVKDLVDIDANGYIVSPDGVHTKAKNIYVAGDVRQKTTRQVVTAVSDGAVTATTVIDELNERKN